jgi:acyl-CoA synthetase (AMP-forming)/AMP-acid ligase II
MNDLALASARADGTPAMALDGLLRARAAERPSDLAFEFLGDESTTDRIALAELDERASAVAAFLRGRDPFPSMALLVHPPGLEFIVAFFGCLRAGTIAIPAPLPGAAVLPQRLAGIIRDSGVTLALTAGRTIERAARLTEREEPLLVWAATEHLRAPHAGEFPSVGHKERVAFLQYTSGSTSAPKGVAVTHGNLVANQRWMQRAYGTDASWAGVSWLPHFHDMGLIGGILHPFFVGFPCTLISPTAFLRRPVRWLRAIRRGAPTISGAPNFAYEQCVRRVSPEEKGELDLTDWRVAFCGSEPVRPATMSAFGQAFRERGFSASAFTPSYGLAESTLLVSGLRSTPAVRVLRLEAAALERLTVKIVGQGEPGRDVVSCGRYETEDAVRIVDPTARTLVSADRIAEIWVRSESVAEGYWKHARETRATFEATLADGSGPYLRTGDLGFVHESELYVTGRLKDVIIIDGRNFFPEDIETTVLACAPAMASAAVAFGLDVEDEEHLVLVVELPRPGRSPGDDRAGPESLEEWERRLRSAVSEEHGIRAHEVVAVRAGTIPRTSSGKVQRAECRARYVAGAFKESGNKS